MAENYNPQDFRYYSNVYAEIIGRLLHDLRHSMSGIHVDIIRTERMKMGHLSERNTYIEKRLHYIAHCHQLFEDIFNKRDADENHIRRIVKNCNDYFSALLKSNVEIISILEIKKKTYTLTISYGEFIMVIYHLISNATDATNQCGNSYVKRINIDLKEKENNLILTISDNGIGIPPELIEKIFDRGFTTKRYGLGVGLHFVKNIIENQCNGFITVESKPNRGSTFVINLPINKHEEKDNLVR